MAAYVIRNRAAPELLVFDHVGLPEAGTQVPAGGVRPGEALDQAVLREAYEETGLRTVSVVDQVAVDDRPHPETHQPRRTAYFHLQHQPQPRTPGTTQCAAPEPTPASSSPAASCPYR